MRETKKIQKVLAPLDGSLVSECVLNYTRAIAAGCDKPEVFLLYVLEPMLPVVPSDLFIFDYIKLENDKIKWANAYLEEKREELKTEGIKAYKILLKGRAAEEIVNYATANDIDLIVMSSHERSGLLKRVFGSVTETVLHDSAVPVLITRPKGCKIEKRSQPAVNTVTAYSA